MTDNIHTPFSGQLLQLLEHPEQFTEAQTQQLLSDPETAALYRQIVETHEALTYALPDEAIGLPDVEEELARVKAQAAPSPVEKKPRRFIGFRLSRSVAAVACAVCLSAAAYGVVRVAWSNAPAKTVAQEERHAGTAPVAKGPETPAEAEAPREGERLFNNVPLSDILTEVATYYDLQVEYRSQSVGRVRLYLRWDKQQSADELVRLLNHFEKVHLTLKDQKLIVG